MNETSISQYITDTFPAVHVVDAWGDAFFFYNPDPAQQDEFYFATLKSKDDEYDSFSDLNRPQVFRLNIGITKAAFQSRFGKLPSLREAAMESASAYDYSLLDELMPHPVYGRQHWVCILNPSAASFENTKPLLAQAYELAVSKYNKKMART
jgi:hypothetical protein